ncbi:MAG: trypsin-like peptidase domain-containing protein [Solirubrobacteraceae bacterium]
MRKLLSTPLVSAVIGGGVTAGVLLAVGVVGAERTRTVYQQSPLTASVAGSGDEPALTAQDIYRRDAPGVAFVRARVLQASPSPFDPYSSDATESTGSGFVLDDEGRVLTNAHVVANATQVTVSLAGDAAREARVIGKDESTDLALLQIETDGLDLEPLALGDSDGVEVGDPTVAIGNPFGFDRTLTTGVISALQRRITAPDGYTIEDVIQTDAAINPGNSGGPLIDAGGRVIGINSQIATGGATGSVGIGFAVPVNTAKAVVKELIAHGRVERPWMGVEMVAIEPGMESLDIGAASGMLVQAVREGSPAAAAGIVGGSRSVGLNTGEELRLGGDVITRVNGLEVRTVDDLRAALGTHEPGDTVPVELMRGGAVQTVALTLANQPAGTADG